MVAPAGEFQTLKKGGGEMKRQQRSVWVLGTIAAFMAGTLSLPALLGAGDLEPPAPPAPTMKTLDEIPPTWSQKLDASERFVLVLDDEAVLDKETGLVWERDVSDALHTWSVACSMCYQKVLGGRKGWRLPSVEELASLIDPLEQAPALSPGHPFTNVLSDHYWSSSTTRITSEWAWRMHFNLGNPSSDDKTDSCHAWCVRGSRGHDAY